MAQEGIYVGNLIVPAFKGDAGEIVEININMVDTDEEPRITNTGTASKAILNLFIPYGDYISNSEVDNEGHLILHFKKGSSIDVGSVIGTGIESIEMVNGDILVVLTDGTQINAGNVYNDEYCQQKIAEYDQNATEKLSELDTAKENALDEVDSEASSAIRLIQTYRVTAVNEITNTKNASITEMNQIKTDVENIETSINNTKSAIDDEKDYIDGVVADFEASEEELQYILGVLGDIEAIIDDINGYDDANEEEY